MSRLLFFSTLFLMIPIVLGSQNKLTTSKYSLYVFEGSDWCMNCRRLEKNVLSDATFKQFLKEESIELIKVDFPQRKKMSAEQVNKNDSLAQLYNFEGGFPTVILSRADTLFFKEVHYYDDDFLSFQQKIFEEIKHLE